MPTGGGTTSNTGAGGSGASSAITSEPNGSGVVDPGINSVPVAAPATELVLSLTSANSSKSDWLGWTVWPGDGPQLSYGVIKFGPDNQIAQSGALRFACPVGTRTVLMASRDQITGKFQSIINVSSGPAGAASSLEIGREFFSQLLLYGKSTILVCNGGALGNDGSGWIFEQEGFSYQASMVANQTSRVIYWAWGAQHDTAIVQCNPRAGTGTNLLYQAGSSSNSIGGGITLRGGQPFAGQKRGGVKLQFNNDGVTFPTSLQMVEVNLNERILALCKGADIDATSLPAGSGDLVTHFAPAATVPTQPPNSGATVYVDPTTQALRVLGQDGQFATLTAAAPAIIIDTEVLERITDGQTTTNAANQVISAGSTSIYDSLDLTVDEDSWVDIEVEHIIKKKGSADGARFKKTVSYVRNGAAAPVLAAASADIVAAVLTGTVIGTTTDFNINGNAIEYRVSPSANDNLAHRIRRTHISGRDALDLADLVLAGYFREGQYVVAAGTGTWTGTASAGASGGVTVAESTNEPAAVAASPDFNGTTNKIVDAALTFGTLFTQAAGTLFFTFDVDAAYADQPNVYSCPGLLAETVTATFGLHFSTAGVLASIYDGTAYRTVKVRCATGKHCGVMRWGAGLLELSVDGSPFRTATMTGNAATPLATALQMGIGYGSVTYFNGRIRCLATMKTKVSDSVAERYRKFSSIAFP